MISSRKCVQIKCVIRISKCNCQDKLYALSNSGPVFWQVVLDQAYASSCLLYWGSNGSYLPPQSDRRLSRECGRLPPLCPLRVNVSNGAKTGLPCYPTGHFQESLLKSQLLSTNRQQSVSLFHHRNPQEFLSSWFFTLSSLINLHML